MSNAFGRRKALFNGGGRVPMMVDKDLLAILACPVCKADVLLQEEKLVCTQCGRKYPIREGIPVMLEEEAEQ